VLIRPGEKIPADGDVVDGESSVNEAMLTGESVPVPKGKGDEVSGGAINGEGALTVAVQRTGEEGYLSQVITMVEEARATQSKTQDLANRAAVWLTGVALGGGALTMVAWAVVVGGRRGRRLRVCPRADGFRPRQNSRLRADQRRTGRRHRARRCHP
jgi:Cu2+-exporting ATPase